MKAKFLLIVLGLILTGLALSQMGAAQAAPPLKPPGQSGPTVLADTAFLPDDWDVSAEIQGGGSYEFRQGNHGNNQTHGIVDITIPPVPQFAIHFVVVTGLYAQQSYDPATQGALSFINFDLTARLAEANWPNPVANVYLTAVQDGRVFYAPPGRAFLTETGDNAWQPFDFDALYAAHFVAWDGTPGNPDFSANGTPLTFGFLTGMNRSQTLPDMPVAETLQLTVDIAEWRVELWSQPPVDLEITSCCDAKIDWTEQPADVSLSHGFDYVITNLGRLPADDIIVSVTQAYYSNITSHDGICTKWTCTFDRLEPGESVKAKGIMLPNRKTANAIYLGTFDMVAEVSADENETNLDNNWGGGEASFYDCGQGCVLEGIFCNLAFGHPIGLFPVPPLRGLEHITQTAQSTFIPDLPFYYDLRHRMLTRQHGAHYSTLYNSYNLEVLGLVAVNGNLWDSTLNTLALWEPHLTALVAGQGDTAVITAEQVMALDTFLTDIAAVASPELAQVITRERANLPTPETFIGKTMAEAETEVLGPAVTRVYLPVVMK